MNEHDQQSLRKILYDYVETANSQRALIIEGRKILMRLTKLYNRIENIKSALENAIATIDVEDPTTSYYSPTSTSIGNIPRIIQLLKRHIDSYNESSEELSELSSEWDTGANEILELDDDYPELKPPIWDDVFQYEHSVDAFIEHCDPTLDINVEPFDVEKTVALLYDSFEDEEAE